MGSLNDLVLQVWSKELEHQVMRASLPASNTGYTPTIIGARYPDPTRILGDDEHHDRLFWKYLVGIGWRKHIIESNGWAGSVQIILVHDKCGKVLDSRALNGLSDDQAEHIGSPAYVTKLISKHKVSSKGCVAKETLDDDDES